MLYLLNLRGLFLVKHFKYVVFRLFTTKISGRVLGYGWLNKSMSLKTTMKLFLFINNFSKKNKRLSWQLSFICGKYLCFTALS